MTRKTYWGIAALLIFVIAAGGFIYWQLSGVQQQRAKTLAETEKFVQWWEERNAPPKNGSSEGPVPDETADTGKRRDVGVSAEKTEKAEDVQKVDNTPDFSSLTPEQQQQIYDQFYIQMGLKPPPRGYRYRWKSQGVPLLDENGNPLLLKIGEPDVRIQMRVGFAPTLEEFERYNQLLDDQGWAEARGDVDEVARLDAELDALEASVQRMRPFVMSISLGDEAASKASRAMKEKLDAALREHGLEHLILSD